MQKSYEDEAVRFLSERKNAIVALEIGELMDKVMDKLHCEFWSRFLSLFPQRLADEEIGNDWRVSSAPTIGQTNRRYGVDVPTQQAPATSSFLIFRFEQWVQSGDLSFYPGIVWYRKRVPAWHLEIEELQKLRQETKKAGCETNDDWPAWLYLEPRGRRGSVLRAYLEEPDEFVQEFVSQTLAFMCSSRASGAGG